jgi:hypothetical protein
MPGALATLEGRFGFLHRAPNFVEKRARLAERLLSELRSERIGPCSLRHLDLAKRSLALPGQPQELGTPVGGFGS